MLIGSIPPQMKYCESNHIAADHANVNAPPQRCYRSNGTGAVICSRHSFFCKHGIDDLQKGNGKQSHSQAPPKHPLTLRCLDNAIWTISFSRLLSSRQHNSLPYSSRTTLLVHSLWTSFAACFSFRSAFNSTSKTSSSCGRYRSFTFSHTVRNVKADTRSIYSMGSGVRMVRASKAIGTSPTSSHSVPVRWLRQDDMRF